MRHLSQMIDKSSSRSVRNHFRGEMPIPPPNELLILRKGYYRGDLEPLSRSLCPGTSFKRNQKVVLPFLLLPPQPAYFLVATSAS